MLTHIELAAKADNAEISLAALKNLQELLFGRQHHGEQLHTSTTTTMPKATKHRNSSSAAITRLVKPFQSLLMLFCYSTSRNESDHSTCPPLPDDLWLVCWDSWMRVAQAIVAPDCPATLDFSTDNTSNNETFAIPTIKFSKSKCIKFKTTHRKHYIPGQYHLSTLLEVYLPLFQRVHHKIPVDDIRSHRLCQIFKVRK